MADLSVGIIGNIIFCLVWSHLCLSVFFFFGINSFSIIFTHLRVQAVKDIIYFTYKSCTYIQSSIKTCPQNPLGCLESRLDLLLCHRLKLMLTSQASSFAVPSWLSFYRLRATPFDSFLVELEFTPLASPPTNLERRWSASSLLSMCSSIFAWLLIEISVTSPRIASANWLKKVYPSWCKDKKKVVAVATR